MQMTWTDEMQIEKVENVNLKMKNIQSSLQFNDVLKEKDKQLQDLKHQLEIALKDLSRKDTELKSSINHIVELEKVHKENVNVHITHTTANESHLQRLTQRQNEQENIAQNIFLKIQLYLKKLNKVPGKESEDSIKTYYEKTKLLNFHQKAEHAFDKLCMRIEALETTESEYMGLLEQVDGVLLQLGKNTIYETESIKTGLRDSIKIIEEAIKKKNAEQTYLRQELQLNKDELKKIKKEILELKENMVTCENCMGQKLLLIEEINNRDNRIEDLLTEIQAMHQMGLHKTSEVADHVQRRKTHAPPVATDNKHRRKHTHRLTLVADKIRQLHPITKPEAQEHLLTVSRAPETNEDDILKKDKFNRMKSFDARRRRTTMDLDPDIGHINFLGKIKMASQVYYDDVGPLTSSDIQEEQSNSKEMKPTSAKFKESELSSASFSETPRNKSKVYAATRSTSASPTMHSRKLDAARETIHARATKAHSTTQVENEDLLSTRRDMATQWDYDVQVINLEDDTEEKPLKLPSSAALLTSPKYPQENLKNITYKATPREVFRYLHRPKLMEVVRLQILDDKKNLLEQYLHVNTYALEKLLSSEDHLNLPLNMINLSKKIFNAINDFVTLKMTTKEHDSSSTIDETRTYPTVEFFESDLELIGNLVKHSSFKGTVDIFEEGWKSTAHKEKALGWSDKKFELLSSRTPDTMSEISSMYRYIGRSSLDKQGKSLLNQEMSISRHPSLAKRSTPHIRFHPEVASRKLLRRPRPPTARH